MENKTGVGPKMKVEIELDAGDVEALVRLIEVDWSKVEGMEWVGDYRVTEAETIEQAILGLIKRELYHFSSVYNDYWKAGRI